MAETNRSSLLQLFQPPVMTVDGVAHHPCPSDTFFSLDTNDVWFNFSQHNFPGSFSEHGSLDFVDHCKILLYLVTLVLALVGNSAVLLAVLKFRNLRGAVNLYCANLVVADILICLCCMWVYLVNHITAPAYILGPFICKINGFVQMTCLTSSVLTLSAISCDRYMAIMFPLRSRVTKKRTDAVIAAIWVFSLLISTPFFHFRRLQTFQWSDYTETNCLEAWPSTSVYSSKVGACVKEYTFKRVYYTLVSTILFFIPLLVMILVYSSIIWKLSSPRHCSSGLPPSFSFSGQLSAIRHRAKRKVIKMSFVILIGFSCCWLPLQIIVLYSLYFHSSHSDGALPEWFAKLSFLATYLAYANTALNPAIYGCFDPRFRMAMRRSWPFCGCNPSTSAVAKIRWRGGGGAAGRGNFAVVGAAAAAAATSSRSAERVIVDVGYNSIGSGSSRRNHIHRGASSNKQQSQLPPKTTAANCRSSEERRSTAAATKEEGALNGGREEQQQQLQLGRRLARAEALPTAARTGGDEVRRNSGVVPVTVNSTGRGRAQVSRRHQAQQWPWRCQQSSAASPAKAAKPADGVSFGAKAHCVSSAATSAAAAAAAADNHQHQQQQTVISDRVPHHHHWHQPGSCSATTSTSLSATSPTDTYYLPLISSPPSSTSSPTVPLLGNGSAMFSAVQGSSSQGATASSNHHHHQTTEQLGVSQLDSSLLRSL